MAARKQGSHRFVRRKLAFLVAAALSGASSPHAAADGGIGAQPLRLPITFQRNDGQFAPEVLFASRGDRGLLTVRAGEIAIEPRGGDDRPALRLRMQGANPAPEVYPGTPIATLSHYYTGPEPIENVPHFADVRMKDVYPGIDVALHGRDGVLEYDFVVAPRADPRDIRIDLRGVEHASLDAQGNLRIEHDGQRLEQRAPVAYQGDGDARHEVPARFELIETGEGPQARLVVGSYDAHEPLTVDPVLVYSTYLGASGLPGTAVKTDAAGRVYYADRDVSASSDVYRLNCLDPATNTLVYQTHFGGTFASSTTVNDVAVGANGAYVAGATTSSTFPVAHSVGIFFDAYVAGFTPQGQLAGGATFGGASTDEAKSIALDPAGNIYVAGSTNSPDFPKTVGPPLNPAPNNTDAFVAKYTRTFVPVYRRLIGGEGNDVGQRVTVDAAGQAIVVGKTSSTTFPIVSVSNPQSPAPTTTRGFAAKLEADGALFVYSQYIGGQSQSADAVALDPTTGDAIVAGTINNASLLPASPRGWGGGLDAYVVRISALGVPLAGTLLGGNGDDQASAVVVNALGDIFVTGTTTSANFPVVSPLPQGNAYKGQKDGFVARLRASTLDFSTYLGGADSDTPVGLALDPDGSLWVSGMTFSRDFPVANARHPLGGGILDGFVAKISSLAYPPPSSPFAGIATRALTLTADNVVIGGFVIGGTAPKTVVVRARGPSLGIPGTLADPTLTLVPASGAPPITNDDWRQAPNAATLAATGFQPGNPKESAILAQLDPGAYTAVMSGTAGSTGIGIVEVYEWDHPEVPLLGISTRASVGAGDNVPIGGFVIEGGVPQTVIVRARSVARGAGRRRRARRPRAHDRARLGQHDHRDQRQLADGGQRRGDDGARAATRLDARLGDPAHARSGRLYRDRRRRERQHRRGNRRSVRGAVARA